MRRIKILFTIPNFILAGSGCEMFNIIQKLDKDVFEPFIAVQQTGGTIYEEALSQGYTVLNFPFTVPQPAGLISSILAARRFSKPFRAYHFDIWQSFNWSSDYTEALVAKFSGAKFLYVKKNMNWNRVAWKLKSFLADGIIARNSTLVETYLSRWPYKKKTSFITGGVDMHKFYPGIQTDVRDRFGIPHGAKLVTCVAQLIRLKDQHTLVKAIQPLKGVYLLLAGLDKDKSYADELKTLVSQLNIDERVIFAGGITRINELLSVSDVFVLPTSTLGGHEEGCPVSLLEAMAVEVPAIASDVAGNRDLIINDRTGLLFPPGDKAALTKCIKRYLDNESFAKQMASAALQRVREHHTLEMEASAFSSLYKRIAGS